MKYLKLLFLFLSVTVFAQNGTPETDFYFPAVSGNYTYGAGGYKLPSEATVNLLLIFAEFPDDQYQITNSRWVKGQPPQNMGNWIDLNYSSNPTQGSLTHYFKDMSGGKLKITGKEIHIVTPNTRREYYNMNKMRGHIHKELIQQLDVTEDFSQYDNWTCNANYDHDPDPDTWVDMIIFVWRNVDKDSSIYSGIQNLGFGSYGDLCRIGTFDVDSGQRHINTGTFGGGATAGSYFSGLYSDPFRLVTHEFSHYLLGWNDMHNGIGFWGMLSDWGVRSLVANSFERYQLNWIDDPSNYYTLDASSSSV